MRQRFSPWVAIVLVGVLFGIFHFDPYRLLPTTLLGVLFGYMVLKTGSIFTGMIAFLSGIVNFGIFPAVEARFFIYFCGIPETISLVGLSISTFPLMMMLLLGISLYFVLTGGQVSVIYADFFQGLFDFF